MNYKNRFAHLLDQRKGKIEEISPNIDIVIWQYSWVFDPKIKVTWLKT